MLVSRVGNAGKKCFLQKKNSRISSHCKGLCLSKFILHLLYINVLQQWGCLCNSFKIPLGKILRMLFPLSIMFLFLHSSCSSLTEESSSATPRHSCLVSLSLFAWIVHMTENINAFSLVFALFKICVAWLLN